MNFFSAIINVNRISDYLPNVTVQDMVNYSTRNMNHYLGCLNNRIYSVASQIVNVASEGGSWNNMTIRDIEIFNTLQSQINKTITAFTNVFGMNYSYCMDVEIIPSNALLDTVCNVPLRDILKPNVFCFESISQGLPKYCAPTSCYNLGEFVGKEMCLPDCFSPNKDTLFSIDNLNPNGPLVNNYTKLLKDLTFPDNGGDGIGYRLIAAMGNWTNLFNYNSLSSADVSSSNDSKYLVFEIIGGVVGGVILLSTFSFIIWKCRKSAISQNPAQTNITGMGNRSGYVAISDNLTSQMITVEDPKIKTINN